MSGALLWAFDLLLGATLLWLAWRLLGSRDLFRAVVLFIAFGLLMALVWARLDAPDIALAEAAIGAGFTGVLLLAALSRSGRLDEAGETVCDTDWSRSLLAVLLALCTVACGIALSRLQPQQRLADLAAARLAESGVDHPVTAVLLAWRGYDTLLEIAVLLIAVVAVWSLRASERGGELLRLCRTPLAGAPALQALARPVLLLLLLTAAYLVWRGGHAPGGAFQAGTLLAAGGMLWLLAGLGALPAPGRTSRRLLIAAGLLVFVGAALATLAMGSTLGYPAATTKLWIVTIEVALTVSIAATLLALFVGCESLR